MRRVLRRLLFLWGAWAKMLAKTRQMRAHAAKSTGVGIMARVESEQQD